MEILLGGMLDNEHQAILRRNSLFADLSENEFLKVAGEFNYLKLKKGHYLFKQEQPADSFFLVVHGNMKMTLLSFKGDEKVIHIIGTGNVFAEAIMFLEQKKYPINAIALEGSSLLQIDAKCYLDVLQRSPRACFKIMANLSQRLHWLLAEIGNLTLHNGTYRLVRFLLNNAQQQITEKNPRVSLSTSKNILASKLSIQPETLSRIFKKLSEDGLLEVEGQRIVILDLDKLQQILDSEV